jgi:hypothetical protein
MLKKKQQYKGAYLKILIQGINLRSKEEKKEGIDTNSKKEIFFVFVLFSLSLSSIKKKEKYLTNTHYYDIIKLDSYA